MELVRGALSRFGGAAPEPILAEGRLLTEAGQAVIDDAEVPREGVKVRRIPVLARRADGSYELWTTRRVSVGRTGAGRLAAVTRLRSARW
ncbi:hypothetical protein ACFWYW_28570 [Nonomuraea sp. NPDC059023]|uniref:hypothetical protein n=1 Tax=unclassified Nonomuraea TaxID=2593643 RepID=UPI00369B10B5